MPGLRMLLGAPLALALCAAPLCGALAAEREPVSGGIPSLPSADAPAAPAPVIDVEPAAPAAPPLEAQPSAPRTAAGRAPDDTTWGVLLRGGYFGLPDAIADRYFNQHPRIEGSMYGAELRYHGEGGGRGGASIGFAVDSGSARADGFWQREKTTKPLATSGEIELLAFTVTGYWVLFPSWAVHPYFGLGVGIAHLEGGYQKDTDVYEIDYWIPAIHAPVGLAVELGPRFQLALEARFIDGISAGGALQARF